MFDGVPSEGCGIDREITAPLPRTIIPDVPPRVEVTVAAWVVPVRVAIASTRDLLYKC